MRLLLLCLEHAVVCLHETGTGIDGVPPARRLYPEDTSRISLREVHLVPDVFTVLFRVGVWVHNRSNDHVFGLLVLFRGAAGGRRIESSRSLMRLVIKDETEIDTGERRGVRCVMLL